MIGAHLLVITNAAAGSAEDEAVEAAVGVLREHADVDLRATAEPGDLDAILDRRDGRTLVVAGGDGSLHAVVRTLFQRRDLMEAGPIGLLPMGTGNDLARGLGLSLDPAEAARTVLAGQTRTLDLIVDDGGGIAVNAVHVGVGAEAALIATRFKDRLGTAAFPVGGAVAGVREPGWQLRVEVDGELVHVGRTLMVGLANASTIGAGTPMAPHARPDDGLIDVVIATSTGPLARVGYALELRRGEHLDRDDVRSVRGRRVVVEGEEFPCNSDGELDGPVPKRTWTLLPAAWSILT